MKNMILTILLSVLFLNFANVVAAKEPNSKIKVYYFHATSRCEGCMTIEKFTINSLESVFEKEMKDSTIVLTSLDFMDEKNEHFQDEYKFDTQALIISKVVDGKEVKWKNLDKIWDYSGNYQKYEKYIKKEINNLLKK